MNEQKMLDVNNLVRAKSRNELIIMCKENNLSFTGTKHDMAVRLLGGWDKTESPGLVPMIPKIIIRRDEMGRWNHEGIIFDDRTKNAIGYLDERTKTLQPLQRSQIEICKKYKFRYVLPDILDENPDALESAAEEDEETGSDDEEEEEDDVPEF